MFSGILQHVYWHRLSTRWQHEMTCWHFSPHCSVDSLNTHHQSLHHNLCSPLDSVFIVFSYLLRSHLFLLGPTSFQTSVQLRFFPPTQLIASHIFDCHVLPLQDQSVPRLFGNVFLNVFLLNGPTPAPSRVFSIHFFGSGEVESNKQHIFGNLGLSLPCWRGCIVELPHFTITRTLQCCETAFG